MSFFKDLQSKVTTGFESLVDSFGKLNPNQSPRHENSFGPYIKFINADTVSHKNYYSILVITHDTQAPDLDLSNASHVGQPVLLDTYHHFRFWRFQISTDSNNAKSTFTYSVLGQSHTVHVPARNDPYKLAFFSCNGFSSDVTPEVEKELNGITPMWTDIMREHEKEPFHGMIGGGDQLYCDHVLECPALAPWFQIKDKKERMAADWTDEMQSQVTEFYFHEYSTHFAKKHFSTALATMPFNFSWDDHDLFDGYGSYPEYLLESTIFRGLYASAKRFYLLFQHHTSPVEAKKKGVDKYYGEKTESTIKQYGPHMAVVMMDVRSQRTLHQCLPPNDWNVLFTQLNSLPATTKHLIVAATLPFAYPRLPFDNTLSGAAKLTRGVAKSLAKIGLDVHADKFQKSGLYTNLVNTFGEPELLDDLNDEWTSHHHIEERDSALKRFQQLSKEKNIRVTFLSGDVHVAGAGRFISNAELKLYPEQDHRLMYQVISSGTGNIPPPAAVVKGLHHFAEDIKTDANTVEQMIDVFPTDLAGNQTELTHLMDARNWCCITSPDKKILVFDIKCEVTRGDIAGVTKTYPVLVPKLAL
ncbi:hypothetical protein BC833DRAFT_618636 [Globomyces pollinis-pini]|nr:hypothetical protein BC833DRAFT_618636 [Globomyces pollinis-pini]KAJ3000283.1 hypothetical protein HDV02_006494 [Globomyces sp. JEL0801]